MKKLVTALMFSLATLSLPALAVSQDDQVELELQAAALATLNSSIPPAPKAPENPSIFGLELKNPFDFLKDVTEQINGVKETLIASFDENGNGKIDHGTEFDNFREGVSLLLTFAADKNGNGKIDADDIGVLTKDAIENLRVQTLTTFCPAVHQQVRLSGIFISVRPLLKHFEKECLKLEDSAK